MSSDSGPVENPRRSAPAAVEVELPFDADGLYALRSALAAHASQLGAPEEQIENLLIVAGELATNAIRHGGGTGTLRLRHRGGVLSCQVTDQGPGFADSTVGSTPPDPADSSASRGIWICRNLTEEFAIGTNPEGRGAVVTAAIPPPSRDHGRV